MTNTITIISNELPISKEIEGLLIDKLNKEGYNTSHSIERDTKLIVSIGGDGSFLKAARDLEFSSIPFFCINTGHLGFFAEILPTEDELDYFVKCCRNHEFNINELPLLQVEIETDEGKFIDYAINEIVVRGNKSRTAHLQLFVNNNYMETFSGDGLILSTSTGSTAYNYSAGGSIVDSSLNIMQITPISPISTNAFRSFTSSIILPAYDTEIKIVPEYKFDKTVLIVIDGEEYKYNNVKDIRVKGTNKKLNLLRLKHYEFWNRVYLKFLKTYDFKESEKINFKLTQKDSCYKYIPS